MLPKAHLAAAPYIDVGRVFVANGQVFVFAPDGRQLGRIDVPDRPLQLVFGGEGGRTLFILTHRSLYAVEP